MSYTFGGNAADDVTIAATGGGNINGQLSAMGGWYYPTTLTGSRYFSSRGNITGLSIDNTLSTSLRFVTDHVTDSIYSAPAGLVTNKWQWFAVLLSNSNALSPPENVRMWAGDANTPPTELTVTTGTAPVGNATGSTSWTIGNRGTASVALQGDAAEQFILSSISGNLLNPAAVGRITDAEAELFRRLFLIPLWRCRPEELIQIPMIGPYGLDFTYWTGHIDVGGAAGTYDGQAFALVSTAPGYKPATFGSSAAFSQNMPPFRQQGRWGIQPIYALD